MSTAATMPTDASVERFLAGVEPQVRREDGIALAQLMYEVTGEAPQMWGPSIVGFGAYHYVYASGHEGDTMRVGFSPRKAQLSLYGLKDHPDAETLLAELGSHTSGAGCIYVKRLSDVNLDVLRHLTRLAYER